MVILRLHFITFTGEPTKTISLCPSCGEKLSWFQSKWIAIFKLNRGNKTVSAQLPSSTTILMLVGLSKVREFGGNTRSSLRRSACVSLLNSCKYICIVFIILGHIKHFDIFMRWRAVKIFIRWRLWSHWCEIKALAQKRWVNTDLSSRGKHLN